MKQSIKIATFPGYTFTMENGVLSIVGRNKKPVNAAENGTYRLTNADGQRISVKPENLVAEFENIEDEAPVDIPGSEEIVETPLAQIDEEIKQPETPPVVESKPAEPAVKRSVKLSLDEAVKIMARIVAGEKQSVIAKEYNVHQSTISDIKAGRLYPKAGGVPTQKAPVVSNDPGDAVPSQPETAPDAPVSEDVIA